MSAKDRLNGEPFTCSNRRFYTDTAKGKPHGYNSDGCPRAGGSVFDEALLDNGGYSLWLECVWDKDEGNNVLWLMWYDQHGSPTIPASGVFGLDDMREIGRRLISAVEVF